MESLLIVGLVYFLPSVIALGRKVPSTGSIVVVNLLLGWTLIGWVVALAWSCRTVPAAHLEELAKRRAVLLEAKRQARERKQLGNGW